LRLFLTFAALRETLRKKRAAPYNDGGTQPVSRFMVTLMVQERKLTGEVMRHFHHPSRHFGAKPVLQTSGLSEQVSFFGRFLAYQILPNFTNFYQKCVAKGVRRGSKRQLTTGFSRPIYLNRVKSGGSCQALSSKLSVISHQSSVLIDPLTLQLEN